MGVPLNVKEPPRRHITASVLSTSRPFPDMIRATIEVTNHSDLHLGRVGIRIDAYDGAKRHLSGSTATVRNLGPGDTKRTDDLLVNAPGRVRLALALDNVHDHEHRDLTLAFTLGEPAPRSSIKTFQAAQRPTARAVRSPAQMSWISVAIKAVRSKDGRKHLAFPKDLNSMEYAIDLIEGVGVSTATVTGYFERRKKRTPWAVQLRFTDAGAEVKHVRVGE